MPRSFARCLIVLAVGAVFAGPAVAVASSEPAQADARMESILEEFDAVVTDAGYVSGGEDEDIDDPLGLTESDDSTTMDECMPDSDGVVADDGTFVGQLVGKASGAYYLTDGEPLGSVDMPWFDHESVGAVVAIVDAEATPSLLAVVEELGSEEFAECFDTAFAEWIEARASDSAEQLTDASVSVEALDLGDAAAVLSVSQSGEDDDGEVLTVVAHLATAMVGDTFIAVVYNTYDRESTGDIVVTALEAAVDAAS